MNGNRPSIDIDNYGFVHINDGVNYATNLNGTFVNTHIIDFRPLPRAYFVWKRCIAIDQDNIAHIVWCMPASRIVGDLNYDVYHVAFQIELSTLAVVNQISDVSFQEDSGPHLVVEDLNTVFADTILNDPINFSVVSTQPEIIPSISKDVRLDVDSDSNFFGQGEVIVTAFESNQSVNDTFTVIITPINDPPIISGLPDSVVFAPDSLTILNIWEYVEDVETPDSLLDYQFAASNDSLIRNYNSATGVLILSSITGFSGNVILYLTVMDYSSATAEDSFEVIISSITGIDEPIAEIPETICIDAELSESIQPHYLYPLWITKNV